MCSKMEVQEFLKNKDMIREWLIETKKTMERYLEVERSSGRPLSTKNRSEIFSSVAESAGADVFGKYFPNEVVNPKLDKLPDLIFGTDTESPVPVEIKISSSDEWAGGKFSKRPGIYLLVSWNNMFEEFFVVMADLEEKDWRRSESKSNYRTNYGKKDILENKDVHYLLGSLTPIFSKKTGQRRCINVRREKLENFTN